MFINIVVSVYLIENHPGNFQFDSFSSSHELLIEDILVVLTKVSYQVVFANFHLLVEYLIVLVTNVFVSLLFSEYIFKLWLHVIEHLISICNLTSLKWIKETTIFTFWRFAVAGTAAISLDHFWVWMVLDYWGCPFEFYIKRILPLQWTLSL